MNVFISGGGFGQFSRLSLLSPHPWLNFSFHFRTSPSKLSIIEELEEESLLPELRGLDKVIHLLEMDIRPHEFTDPSRTNSLSSSEESSDSNFSIENDENNSHPTIIYEQMSFAIWLLLSTPLTLSSRFLYPISVTATGIKILFSASRPYYYWQILTFSFFLMAPLHFHCKAHLLYSGSSVSKSFRVSPMEASHK